MIANQASINILQGLYFVMLARSLGVDQYGVFSAMVALVAVVSPFGSLGALNLMIRRVAVDNARAPKELTVGLLSTLMFSSVLIVFGLFFGPLVAPHGTNVFDLCAILVGDLVGIRLTLVAGGIFQATERLGRTAVYPVLAYLVRASALGALLALHVQIRLGIWSMIYGTTSVAVGTVCILLTYRVVGFASASVADVFDEWKDGLFFATGFAAQSVYNDIDKVMLGKLSTASATGNYVTAYRIVDITFTPIRAMLAASQARFFVEGQRGIGESVKVAAKLIPAGLAYAVSTSIVLFVSAPLAPAIFGSDYAGSVHVVRALCLLPLLKLFHYLAADSLSGARMQGIRTVAQCSVAATNVLLNLVLIPDHGVNGAILTSLLSDGSLAIILWLVVYKQIRRSYTSVDFQRHMEAT